MQEGVCVVVSPLLALMHDQVESLLKKNIKAVALNKPLSQDETVVVFDNILFNNIKFLYLSPEKLETRFIQNKIKQLNVSLVAIDEAHCISEWGHDFRPSYLSLKKVKELCPSANLIALTGSATPEVIQDISTQLEIKTAEVYKKSFNRENIAYQLFEVEDKIFKIKQILTKTKAPCIIYTNSRNETKRISNILNSQGFKTTFYHGGLSSKEKQTAYNDWYEERKPIIVATNAFGMGIDKSNIRVVIHVAPPNSIENYMQEAGRTGRDGKRAFAVMLLKKNDVVLFKTNHREREISIEFLKKVYFKLNQFYKISKGELSETEYKFDLREFSSQYNFSYSKTSNALKTLMTHQLISFTEGFQKRTTLQFTTSSKNDLNYCDRHQSINTFVTTILRNYGGLFENTITLNEFLIAKKLKISQQQVISNFEQLEKDEIIRYNPSNNSSKLSFLVPRDDDRTINSISKSIKKLRQNKDFKASAIVDFIENQNRCRSRQLLEYFQETKTVDCEICDVCLTNRGVLKKTASKLPEAILSLLKLEKEKSSREIVLSLIQYEENDILNALSCLAEESRIVRLQNRKFNLTKKQ